MSTGGQVPDCMELLLQVIVSSPTKMQGAKLDSFTRAVRTLNLGTMSPDPSSGCFIQDCHLYCKPLNTKLIPISGYVAQAGIRLAIPLPQCSEC